MKLVDLCYGIYHESFSLQNLFASEDQIQDKNSSIHKTCLRPTKCLTHVFVLCRILLQYILQVAKGMVIVQISAFTLCFCEIYFDFYCYK